MRIIVVGCGKIGFTIAKVLSSRKSIDVTIVDIDSEVLDDANEQIDAIFVAGNGVNERVLVDAGAKTADLIVCTTSADEINVLCCIMAERLGTLRSIARVRDPDYSLESNQLWKDLGIDVVINPEQLTAREISRLLRYPAADGVEVFYGGRVELVTLRVAEAPEFFVGKSVSQVFRNNMGLLLALVGRADMDIIPHGDLVFEESDVVKVLGRPSDIMGFFAHLKKRPRIQDAVLIGGGRITYYLAELLHRHAIRTNVKIVEKDQKKCEALNESLSDIDVRCLVLRGDGTNEEILTSEGINDADAFVCLTDRDEENAIISLYAARIGVKKVITKVNFIHRHMIQSLGLLGNIITPQDITTDIVVRFVDGLTGAAGSNARVIHRISIGGGNGETEAVEFLVNKKAKCTATQMKDLNLLPGILIGCIGRGSDIVIPRGKTMIQPGDSVVVITKMRDMRDIDDILA